MFKNQRRKWLTLNGLLFLASPFLAGNSRAAIPSAEKLLPDDTLVLFTVPDFAKLREVYKASPQSKFWNDPAMKPLTEYIKPALGTLAFDGRLSTAASRSTPASTVSR